MDKWPLGVFASIDAGLGVGWKSPTSWACPRSICTPRTKPARTKRHAEEFLARLQALGIRITVVFGGFEGESYADIPTAADRRPGPAREPRGADQGDAGDRRFRPAAGRRRGGAAPGLGARTTPGPAPPARAGRDPRGLRPLPMPTGSGCTWRPARNRPTRCCTSSATSAATTCSSISIRPT